MSLDEPTHNSGRILDYWLGGTDHGPADVAAAKVFESIYPGFPAEFRVLRQFIGRGSRYIHAQGIDQFLVLGAGVPTQGNVHEVVPEARVLYTDIDPVNIQRGQEILAGIPRTGYTYCDASDLSTLTTPDRTVVERVLGPLRRVGVIMVGVSAFIPDDKLRLIFRDLYEWAPKGSYLLFDFDSTKGHEIPAAVELMGDGFYMRTAEAFAPLLGDWRITEDGIQPVGEWRSAEAPAGILAVMYGGLAYKP